MIRIWTALLWMLASTLLMPNLAMATDAAADEATDVAKEADAEDETQPTLTLEDILNRNPEADDYVDNPRCISRGRIRKTRVIDEQHVSIQVSRSKYYLIALERPCIGLRKDRGIVIESRGARLCNTDAIRGLSAFGGFDPGPLCTIGEFQSVTKEQLVLLEENLEATREQRKRNRKGKKRKQDIEDPTLDPDQDPTLDPA